MDSSFHSIRMERFKVRCKEVSAPPTKSRLRGKLLLIAHINNLIKIMIINDLINDINDTKKIAEKKFDSSTGFIMYWFQPWTSLYGIRKSMFRLLVWANFKHLAKWCFFLLFCEMLYNSYPLFYPLAWLWNWMLIQLDLWTKITQIIIWILCDIVLPDKLKQPRL